MMFWVCCIALSMINKNKNKSTYTLHFIYISFLIWEFYQPINNLINQNNVTFTEEENNSDSNCGGKHAPLREQDRFLPIANIVKIMKRAIPTNGKVT